MEDFKARQPFVARTEYNAKCHCVVLRIDSVEQAPPRLGLRVGDVANNFRASLDHLAWALVKRGSKWPIDPKREGNVYFPVAFSRDDFAKKIRSQLPGLLASDRAIIRRYQPYVHGQRKMPLHCLTPLPRLTADDKHRAIRTVLVLPRGGALRHGEGVDCTITRIPTKARGVIFDAGAELQRIYVRKTGPNPDVYMEATLTTNPTLDGRVALQEWLTQTINHIGGLLREFAWPPDELKTIPFPPGTQEDLSLEGIVPT